MLFRQDTLAKDFDVFHRMSMSLQDPATVESFFKNDKEAPGYAIKFLLEVKQAIPAAAVKLNLEKLVNTSLKLNNKDLSHGMGREKCQGMEL